MRVPLAVPAVLAALAARIAGAAAAARPGVVDRLLDLYPADGPLASAATGQVTTSRAALRAEIERFWENVGQNMQGPRFVIGERHAVRLGPDAGAITLTYSIPHRTPSGRPHVLGGAWTAVFARSAGRWVIVQEHLSDVPRVPGTGRDSATADGAHDHAGHE